MRKRFVWLFGLAFLLAPAVAQNTYQSPFVGPSQPMMGGDWQLRKRLWLDVSGPSLKYCTAVSGVYCTNWQSVGGGGSTAWADITGKPTNFQSDWNSTVINKPSLFDGTWASLSGKPSTFPPSTHSHVKTDISDFPATWAWANLTGVPSTFTPSSHSHPESDVTNLVSDLAGKSATGHTHVKANITDFSHTHAESEVTSLVTDLAGKSSTSHTHSGVYEVPLTFNSPLVRTGNAVDCSGCGGGGGSTFLKVSGADYTNASNPIAYTNVTGLTMSVTSGVTYTFNCDLIVSSAATTTGIQIAVNGPANSFLRYNAEYFTSATAKATWSATTYDATASTSGTFPINSSGTVITSYKLNGQFVATANGTFAIRGRNEVISSAITVYRGSSCSIA